MDIYYKIPLIDEKDILINQFHINNNHVGRITLIHLLHEKNWY